MAMEPGGRAEKLGNEFERLWCAKQFLLLLAEETKSVLVEGLGPDEQGVDLWVTYSDGRREGQQCKRENGIAGKWSVADLYREGVLTNARYQLELSDAHWFTFVSSDPAPLLSDLTERTHRCQGDPEKFVQFELTSRAHRKEFSEFCRHLALDEETLEGRATAFGLLARMSFEVVPRLGRRDVERLASRYVSGPPSDVVALLADFAIQSIGNEIAVLDVRAYLRETGHPPLDLINDPSVARAIELIQKRFHRFFSELLIAGEVLRRAETDQLIDALIDEQAVRAVILHGNAGVGKSGVVFELTQRLEARSILYLPIRFDQQRPAVSPGHFGRDVCGLPASPGHSLASIVGSSQTGILILDQLDAIRWTSVHSATAMDVFQEVVDEALAQPNLRVLVVCRTFDMSDHPRIRAWKDETKATEIPVGPLSEPELIAVLAKLGGDVSALTARQKGLLCIPQNLFLWSRLSEATRQSLNSAADLMRAFWREIRENRLKDAGVSSLELDSLVRVIVDQMERTSALTCSARLVEPFASAAKLLKSLDVLKDVDETRVGFSHQSFFDYLLAERLITEVLSGGRTVLDWLKTNQSLFRREQLRLVLTMLRDDDLPAYVNTIRSILHDDSVRFHLKQLVLRCLGTLDSLRAEEVQLVVALLCDKAWRDHVLSHVLWNRPQWFKALSDVGYLSELLASSEGSQYGVPLSLMRPVYKFVGDLIASLLGAHLGQDSAKDGHIIETILWFRMSEETKPLFKLHLTLLRQGNNVGRWIDWKELSELHPSRVIRVLDAYTRAICDNLKQLRANAEDVSIVALTDHLRSHEKYIVAAAEHRPRSFLRKSLRFIRLLSMARPARLKRTVWRYGFVSSAADLDRKSRELLALLCNGCTAAAARLLERGKIQPERLSLLTNGITSLTFQQSMARMWLELGNEWSDAAINWLCDDTRRFRLRRRLNRSPFTLAQKLVKRHSANCSNKAFARFEESILSYRDPTAWADYKRTLQVRRVTDCYPNDIGLAQLLLLEAADRNRLSPRALQALDEMHRKYEGIARPGVARSHGGWVHSPISSEHVDKLSDKHWLQIIQSDLTERNGRWRRVKGGFVEASHDMFARDIGQAATQVPNRFAKLLLRIDPKADASYAAAIVSAISGSPSYAHTATQDEGIISHIGFTENTELAIALCRFMRTMATHGVSSGALELLIRYATSHPHPAPDEFIVGKYEGEGQQRRGVNDLDVSSINCVRGVAATALRTILFESPATLPVVRSAIDSLVADPAGSVRAAAVGTCLPILNVDRTLAIDYFIRAIDFPDDRVLATEQVRQFLSYTIVRDTERIAPVVHRMLASNEPEVCEKGASWATVAWLENGHLSDCVNDSLSDQAPRKLGVARVLRRTLTRKGLKPEAFEILSRLFDDDDKDVRHEAAGVFWDADVLDHPEAVRLAQWLVESKSLFDAHTGFFHRLTEHTGAIRPFGNVFFRACERLEAKARESRQSGEWVSADVHDLPRLVLRLYEEIDAQSDPEAHMRCLDMWDSMLRAGIGETNVLLEQLF